MGISILASIVGFLASVIAIGISFGVQKQKLIVLEERIKEDRENDRVKFKELFDSRNEMEKVLVKLTESVTNLIGAVTELRGQVQKDLNGLGEKLERALQQKNS